MLYYWCVDREQLFISHIKYRLLTVLFLKNKRIKKKMTKNVKVLKEGSQDVWCTSLLISFLLGTKMIKKLKKTNVYLQHKSTVCNSEVRGGDQMHAQCYAKKQPN